MLQLMLTALLLLAGATVQGTVRSAGSLQPIPNAALTIDSLNRSVGTDEHGYFVIPDLPAGEWQVRASALGYAASEITVVSAGSGRIRLDFELEPAPVRLGEIAVRSGRADRAAADAASAPAGPPAARLEGDVALKYMPGLAEPDVLRAVQSLPSVAAISDFSSAPYVRGGAADQTIIELDGMPLYNPYHLGGVFSALNADAVGAVDVHAGALPASAADRLAGVVSIRSKTGARDSVRVSGNVGLISSNATVHGPLFDGKGSFLVSGRRTYVDAVSSAVYRAGLINNSMPYGFSDLQLNLTRDVGAFGTLTLSGYLDRERVSVPERMRNELTADPRFNWGSRMLSLSYRQPLGAAWLFENRIGYTDFTGRFSHLEWVDHFAGPGSPGGPLDQEPVDTTESIRARTMIRDVVAESSLRWYSARHALSAGVRLDAYGVDHFVITDVEYNDLLPELDEEGANTNVAAYVEDEWRIADSFRLRLGLRGLHAADLGSALLPRVGFSAALSPSLSLFGGGGAYAQALRSMRDDESFLSSFIAYDILTLQSTALGLARGKDAVLGISWTNDRSRITLNGYMRAMDRLGVRAPRRDPMELHPLAPDDSIGTAKGKAEGIELQAQHRTGPVELGLSYAWANGTRTVDGLTYEPRFARRHMFDLSAVYSFSDRGLLSGRLMIGSGQPYTEMIGVVEPMFWNAAQGKWNMGVRRLLRGPHNASRLPGYARFDVAVRKNLEVRWFGKDMTVTPYGQILNLLGSQNVVLADPTPYGKPEVKYYPQLPTLPTFGLEWRF